MDWDSYFKAVATEALEDKATEVKHALVNAAKDALGDYYKFPKGAYNRTYNFLNNSFLEYEHKELSDPKKMRITVGVDFERNYEYPVHGPGVTSEDIYSWNLEGWHGDNGNSGDILEKVNKAADEICSK